MPKEFYEGGLVSSSSMEMEIKGSNRNKGIPLTTAVLNDNNNEEDSEDEEEDEDVEQTERISRALQTGAIKLNKFQKTLGALAIEAKPLMPKTLVENLIKTMVNSEPTKDTFRTDIIKDMLEMNYHQLRALKGVAQQLKNMDVPSLENTEDDFRPIKKRRITSLNTLE